MFVTQKNECVLYTPGENENTNTQMNELRDMMQKLVGAMAAQ